MPAHISKNQDMLLQRPRQATDQAMARLRAKGCFVLSMNVLLPLNNRIGVAGFSQKYQSQSHGLGWKGTYRSSNSSLPHRDPILKGIAFVLKVSYLLTMAEFTYLLIKYCCSDLYFLKGKKKIFVCIKQPFLDFNPYVGIKPFLAKVFVVFIILKT